jgi:hypothetical protein
MCAGCVSFLPSQDKTCIARKLAKSSHEATADGLSGFYLGRDHKNQEAKLPQPNHPHGPMREAQAYKARKLHERDLNRVLEFRSGI